ncbi:MAG TPA: aspartate 1-decarboxylase [Candidatus Hydrogenedentes bacterium]|jgi:aspartate 1-decarboxylase|nr:aspartate 1-decarboxylase [Candidatus Hydrogenedentota bacterium]
MMLCMLKSKIHRATITQAELHYPGSITIDPELMEAAGILSCEQVHVLNLNTGARFETYAIEGERGSRVICLNGPAARLGQVGDIVVVLTYAMMDAEEARGHKAAIVHVDAGNNITEVVHGYDPN